MCIEFLVNIFNVCVHVNVTVVIKLAGSKKWSEAIFN